MHYAIGGTVEAEVHSCEAGVREAAITNGERRLSAAHQALTTGFEAARVHADRQEYVREQQVRALQAAMTRAANCSPSR